MAPQFLAGGATFWLAYENGSYAEPTRHAISIAVICLTSSRGAVATVVAAIVFFVALTARRWLAVGALLVTAAGYCRHDLRTASGGLEPRLG